MLLFFQEKAVAQVQQARLSGLYVGQGLAFSGAIYALSKAWYRHPLKHFHRFDDSGEWLQQDKAGHFYTSYQLARLTASAYEWAGLPPGRAAAQGGISGLAFMLPIEILDGFSPEYGFSWSDMAANLAGPALLVAQQRGWGQVRISPKFSVHATRMAALRPERLGHSWKERWLKDYNGQTYWLSTNIAAFQPRERRVHWPKMLNVAVGYGIDNMVAARRSESLARGYAPVRRFLLSPDVDLTRIPSQSAAVKTLLLLANCLKIPAPALEIRTQRHRPRLQVKLHAVYF